MATMALTRAPGTDDVQRPPLPAGHLDFEVSAEQVAFFHTNGYVVVDRITTDDEVEWLRNIYDQLFERRIGGFPGAYIEPSRPNGAEHLGLDSPLSQVMLPEHRIPELRHTIFYGNGMKAAAALMDLPESSLHGWGHMITKPAGNGDIAPWHQDEAYWEPELRYQAVGTWMALDDADIDNGCLWFVPGSHRGDVLAHRHLDGDPSIHTIVVVDPVDMADAVPVPVKAGCATIHHPRTLHYSGPNRTDRRRRAYATEFQTPPVRREVPADRPWVIEGRRAAAELLSAKPS
jgi:ectoine hydroxylase-related dioxygenase (phytanoyl-CoA dioxygenase family)